MTQPNTKRTDRVGEIFTNSWGSKYKIIEYRNANDVTIQFLDEHGYIKKTGYRSNPKNPYDKTVAGVGYIGQLNNGDVPRTIDYKREYMHWQAMIGRCYGSNREGTSYEDCTMDEKLLCFAYFVEHINEITNYEEWLVNPDDCWHIDKDLKYPGNKHYSIENCTFLRNEDNVKEEWNRTNGNKMKIKLINIQDNSEIIFDSMKEAKDFLNTHHRKFQKLLNNEINNINGFKAFIID